MRPSTLRKRRPGQSRAAFTLVELLTVIAIIGVLAAVLFPIIGSIQNKARVADSTSRLRNLGNAALLYTAEHNGAWPRSTHSYSRQEPQWWLTFTNYLWTQPITRASDPALQTYLEQVLRDPLDPAEKDDGSHDNRYSYASNVHLQLDPENDRHIGNWSTTYSVPSPASTVLFATSKLETSDHFMAQDWGSDDDAAHDLDLRNGDRAGFVYCDGHVQWLTPEETFDPANGINQWNPSLAAQR